ncbi:cell cycle checkpoint protein RAD17-like [Lytechinus pictus]|uniref:cell cycle checkpoint protein RAD17-like n=1 Tax=Lytechinus pictus TaxID=7653 RepID=UPI0030BA1BF5
MHQWVSSSFGDFEERGTTKGKGQSSGKHGPTSKGQDRRKRPRVDDRKAGKAQSWSQKKKFLEGQTWAERHAPQSVADLAVHKKKIQEVQDWLTFHTKQRGQTKQHTKAPLLLLTGPAGAGKTATLTVLSKELGLELQEWSNPITEAFKTDQDTDYRSDFYTRNESQVKQFQDFLKRANRYPALSLVGEQEERAKKVVLVEDIPNAFYRDPSSLHAVLTRFSLTGRSPLVFIVSDSHGGKSNVLSLFPSDVQDNLAVHNISFNPVAPTSMTKTMTRIATAEAAKARHKFYVPSKSTIEALSAASSGDIRGAINALQFSCLKGTDSLQRLSQKSSSSLQSSWSSTPSSSSSSSSMGSSHWKDRRKHARGSKDDEEDKRLAAIGGRDTSLFLFRALGKVLYCKREPKTVSDPVLPPHLNHHERDRLIMNPEELIERTHMSSENFTLYLHQNYLDFYTDLEDVVEGSRYLSDTDFLTCEWTHRTTMREYSSSVAVRSLVHFNSSRSRCNQDGGSGGGGRGWKPLHKPEWFEVSRKYRESCTAAKGLFIGHCWTPLDLQTQLLPYLALINVPLKNPGQFAFLQDVTRFSDRKQMRKWPKKLDEKDIDDASLEEDFPSSQSSVTSSQNSRPKLTLNSQNTDALDDAAVHEDEDDEEIIIEDYDDDFV